MELIPVIALARMPSRPPCWLARSFQAAVSPIFWGAQQAGSVARIAVLGDDLVRRFCTAAARCSGDFHPFALLPLHTHLANRLQALGNVIIGRSLSADSP